MEYRGHVKDGKIVLDRRVVLEEGTEVSVRPIEQPTASPGGGRKRKQGQTLLERLGSVVGKAEGLPSDLAENHDHYLHGRPKK